MSDIIYPKLCVSANGYNENPERGSTLHRAEDGTPWIVNLWPETRYTFDITHPALSADEQMELEQFYDQHIGDEVGWDNPRRQERWIVRMVGPPRLASMRDGMRGDVEMTLVGYRGTAPTYSVPPVVSGLHQIGQVISVSQGTWQSEYPMQFEYQWLRNGEPIAGATGQNYTLVDDDLFNMISARVTASSLGGSTSVETDPVRARLDSVVSWLYSDIAETIFVDVEGNTPATWGDPVGLIKDSSGNGNDFTQPTVTARPILGRVPRGGRRNLLRNTEVRGSSWNFPNNTGRQAGVAETPDGYRADRLTLAAAVGHQFDTQLQEPLALGKYVVSIWVCFETLPASYRFQMAYYDGGSVVSDAFSPTIGPEHLNKWTELSATFNVTTMDVTNPRIRFNGHSLGDEGTTFLIGKPQLEKGDSVTPYQTVTTRYDITEEGVPDVYYLDFDGTDDLISTEIPAIENGTLVIAGTNGIWIDDDYNFDGGTFSIGTTSYTNGLDGILTAIGEPITGGLLVINRQLTQRERELVIQEMKESGAPGVFELGPELLVNGDFSDGFDGWTLTGSEPERWSVSDGVATIAVGATNSAHLRQFDVTEGGLPHLITVDIVSSNGVGLIRAGGGNDNNHAFLLAGHPVGEISAAFVSGGAQPNVFQVYANASTQASISNMSFRQLELIP